MGRRAQYETLVRILDAFREKNSWRQPDLAERVQVQVPALKSILRELEQSHMRLERFEESPSEVYWSVPSGWEPGGVYLQDSQVELLFYAVAQLPQSELRDAVMERAAASKVVDPEMVARLQEVVVTPVGHADAMMRILFAAATRRKAVHCHYHSSSSGRRRWRFLSVHRIFPGHRARVLATCHESGALRIFRLSSMLEVEISSKEAFRPGCREEIEAMLAASVGGFFSEGPNLDLSFRVVGPTAEWVRNNLMPEMKAETIPEGIRVRLQTAAVDPVARFLVGLGPAAHPEHPALAEAVLRLARGAAEAARSFLEPNDSLETNESESFDGHERTEHASLDPIRSTD